MNRHRKLVTIAFFIVPLATGGKVGAQTTGPTPEQVAIIKIAVEKVGGTFTTSTRWPTKEMWYLADFYNKAAKDESFRALPVVPFLVAFRVVNDKAEIRQERRANSSTFTDAGVREISRQINLEWLDLRHSNVTFAGVTELANLTRLRELHLSCTFVGDLGLKEIGKLGEMQEPPVTVLVQNGCHRCGNQGTGEDQDAQVSVDRG